MYVLNVGSEVMGIADVYRLAKACCEGHLLGRRSGTVISVREKQTLRRVMTDRPKA